MMLLASVSQQALIGAGSGVGTTEIAPHASSFTRVHRKTDQSPESPVPLRVVDETFDSDTGQMLYTSESSVSAEQTTGTIANGEIEVSNSGTQNMIARTGADWDGRPAWVEIGIVSRSAFSGSYNNIGVGMALDKDNFVFASFDEDNNLARIQVKNAGTNAFLGSETYTLPASGAFRIGLSLSRNTATAWINTGSGWTALTSAQTTANSLDMQTMALAGWKAAFTVATSGGSTWTFDNLRYGSFAGVCIRDITLVTNEDGTPALFGSNYRFSATITDDDGAGHNAFFEYNPDTFEIEQTGAILVERGGVRQADLNAHLVRNDDGTWRVLLATWGDRLNGLDVLHLEDCGDISTGFTLLSGMTALTLPLIPGTGSGGAYDPYLVKDGANWLLAYAVVDNVNFSGENFYIAAASSPDLTTFTGIGSDPTRTKVEGPKIVPFNGSFEITGGGRGEQPFYDTAMAFLGDPAFTPDLYTGSNTQPHVQVLAHGNDWQCLTWEGTQLGSGFFTTGYFNVYSAPRFA